jgi:hypothetical protein
VIPRSPSDKAAPSLPPSLPPSRTLSLHPPARRDRPAQAAAGQDRPPQRHGATVPASPTAGPGGRAARRDQPPHGRHDATPVEGVGGVAICGGGGVTRRYWNTRRDVAMAPTVAPAGAHQRQLGPGHKERRGGRANFFIVQKTFPKCYVGHSGKLRRMPMFDTRRLPLRRLFGSRVLVAKCNTQRIHCRVFYGLRRVPQYGIFGVSCSECLHI